MGDGRKEDNVNGNGNPPVLLEAVNKNGLALFLIVGLPPFIRNSILLNLEFSGWHTGQFGNGCDQPDTADDVHVKYPGDARVEWVCDGDMWDCLGLEG